MVLMPHQATPESLFVSNYRHLNFIFRNNENTSNIYTLYLQTIRSAQHE